MHTMLDYIAWITIVLAAATLLFLLLATCLLIVQAVAGLGRRLSNPTSSIHKLPDAVRHAGDKLRLQSSNLLKQSQKLLEYVVIHSSRSRHRV